MSSLGKPTLKKIGLDCNKIIACFVSALNATFDFVYIVIFGIVCNTIIACFISALNATFEFVSIVSCVTLPSCLRRTSNFTNASSFSSPFSSTFRNSLKSDPITKSVKSKWKLTAKSTFHWPHFWKILFSGNDKLRMDFDKDG